MSTMEDAPQKARREAEAADLIAAPCPLSLFRIFQGQPYAMGFWGHLEKDIKGAFEWHKPKAEGSDSDSDEGCHRFLFESPRVGLDVVPQGFSFRHYRLVSQHSIFCFSKPKFAVGRWIELKPISPQCISAHFFGIRSCHPENGRGVRLDVTHIANPELTVFPEFCIFFFFFFDFAPSASVRCDVVRLAAPPSGSGGERQRKLFR
ncbi:hypothetical protein RQP46_005734 [Phenoliferia psychrophenolica]